MTKRAAATERSRHPATGDPGCSRVSTKGCGIAAFCHFALGAGLVLAETVSEPDPQDLLHEGQVVRQLAAPGHLDVVADRHLGLRLEVHLADPALAAARADVAIPRRLAPSGGRQAGEVP
jgi:hypothetical protein